MHARGPLPPRTAASIARKIADALAASHAANVIHRDLKPENVFLVGTIAGRAAEDEIRIVDFGAAKVIGGACKLTRPGIVFGTPYYMSPEQASGSAALDARADVYSLGILLYEMLTGNVPFEADTYMGVLTKHMFAEPISPSEKRPGVPLGQLEEVTLRALAKDPADRFSSMTELSAALATIEGAASSDASTPNAPNAPPRLTLPLGSMSSADRIQVSIRRRVDEEARRKRRLIAIGIVAACGTLGVGAAISLALNGSSPSSASASAQPAISKAPPVTSGKTIPSASAPRESIPPPPASAPSDDSSSAVSPTNVAARKPPLPAPPPASRTHNTPSASVPSGRPASPSTPPQGPEDFRDPWADPPKR